MDSRFVAETQTLQTLLLVGVVLLAILVGASVAALWQLRSTLKSAQKFLDANVARVQRALDGATEAIERVNALSSGVEEGVVRLKTFFEGVASVGRTLQSVQGPIRTAAILGSAVGPAVITGVRALFPRAGRRGEEAPESGRLRLVRPGEKNFGKWSLRRRGAR